ncbi:MAG: hypothetical protein NPIRA01_29540 [Nitrospirales bacterium]|nr:MAG: hypothetical protein NPIRA01_29540 [Nitrospirales bacterium]
MFLEVESNLNCESSVFLRFKEVSPPLPITHIKVYDRLPQGEWCSVTGWCEDTEQPLCTVFAQKVEDSGAGIATLIFGGPYGIRLKLEQNAEAWDLESDQQWGEPYLLLSGDGDIRYV